MKLSLWVFNYRKEHSLSMQAMADLCGLSKQYISVLEKGINPKTKKKFIPTIETIKKIADATGTDISALFNMLDSDQEIVINSAIPFPDFDKIAITLSAQEHELIVGFRNLNSAGQKAVSKIVKNFASDPDYVADSQKEAATSSA